MKTSILEQSETQKSILNEEFEIQFEQMASYQARMRTAAHKLELLEKELNEMGLDMVEYHTPTFEPFSLMGNRNMYDTISIKIIAKKQDNSKFRFITFQGYNSHGKGRNRNRLQAKAKKMESALSTTAQASCSINPFSLQQENREGKDKEQKVLIRMKVES